MTHTEDVKRVSTLSQVDFLNARIQALENRVQFLEAQLEVAKQVNFNRYE